MNLFQFKSSDKNTIVLITILHILIIGSIYYIYHCSRYAYPMPGEKNLIQFDAYFYDSIRKTGYQYVPGVGNNLAFFPLFPIFWKWTGVSATLISLINYIIFSISFIQLLRTEKLHFITLLLLISFPSYIFFALPYSESLFFLFCTFIVIGLKKQSDSWLYIGLFGASMVRSVCLVFIPAIIICELLNYGSRETKFERIRKTCYKLVAAIAGLLVAMSYVAYKTGTWFYFIEIQKYWHREWQMIKLPFTTISPERALGLDGITFVIGILAIGIIIKNSANIFSKYYTKDRDLKLKIDQSVIFSMLYIAGMIILDTFFTTRYKEQTNIWSLNRHVMCTPFAITFLIFLLRDYQPTKFAKLLISSMLLACIFITGVYQYINIQVLLFFFLFICNTIILKYFPGEKQYFPAYYIVAVYLQVYYYKEFLLGGWLG